MHHVAAAALPVAIGLLIATGAARAVLAMRLGDQQAQRTARRHLDPLAVWCVIAAGADVLATGAAGDASLGAFAAPIAIAAVAGVLRSLEDEPDGEPASPAPAAPAPPPPARQWSRD
jgi:hypothetical protein